MSILVKTETGFKKSTDYTIVRNLDEFSTDILLRSGADLSKQTKFSSGDDLSSFDNATLITNEILNMTDENEK